MEVRRRNNIKAAGTVQNVASEKDLYCALINNSVFVKIGARFELPRDILISSCGKQIEQFDLCCSGHQWAVWQIKEEEDDAHVNSLNVVGMETTDAEVPPSTSAVGVDKVDMLLEKAKQQLEEEGKRFRDLLNRPHSKEEAMIYSAKLVAQEEEVAKLEKADAKLKTKEEETFEGGEKLFEPGEIHGKMKGQVGNAEGSDAEQLDESDVIKNAPKDVDEFESGWA